MNDLQKEIFHHVKSQHLNEHLEINRQYQF